MTTARSAIAPPGAHQTDEQKAERIDKLLREEGKIDEIRVRLVSVSEFMKCLNEHIARRANLEDKVTGRSGAGTPARCQVSVSSLP